MTNKEKAQALRELAAWCEKWEVEIDSDCDPFGIKTVRVDSTFNSKTKWVKLIHESTINEVTLITEAQRLDGE